MTPRKRGTDLATRAAAVARPTAERDADTEVRTTAVTQVRVKPVNLTVQVQPIEHRALLRQCEILATDLGLTRVAGSEVLRVLLGMLTDGTDDGTLADAVKARLVASGGSRR